MQTQSNTAAAILTTAEVNRYLESVRSKINLMAQAIHLVDDDIEQTGTVSVQTIEFLRSVKQVIA